MKCLLDTGSMVSTVTEAFYQEHLAPKGTPLKSNGPCLHITAVNGLEIPYIGYLELDLDCDGILLPQMGLLVVRNAVDASIQREKQQAPGLLGMNVLASLVSALGDAKLAASSPLHFLKSVLCLKIDAKVKEQDVVSFVQSGTQPTYIPANTSVTVLCSAAQPVSF